MEAYEAMGETIDIKVVTTFHNEGYELYGKRFLESFAENVDKKIVHPFFLDFVTIT